MGTRHAGNNEPFPLCGFVRSDLDRCPGYELIELGARPSTIARFLRLPPVRTCLHLTASDKPGGFIGSCQHPERLAERWWADYQAQHGITRSRHRR